MKKNAIKAFTLVEMLIVIVIIGILIASLMPRMSAAQGRARDVARKNDVNQISTAMQAYNGDHNKYPLEPTADAKWSSITSIGTKLQEAGLGSVPKDPQSEAKPHLTDASAGEYAVKIMRRNGVDKAGYVIASYVETPGSANYVLCDTSTLYQATNTTDTNTLVLCTDVNKAAGTTCVPPTAGSTNCEYTDVNQLAYILAY